MLVKLDMKKFLPSECFKYLGPIFYNGDIDQVSKMLFQDIVWLAQIERLDQNIMLLRCATKVKTLKGKFSWTSIRLTILGMPLN